MAAEALNMLSEHQAPIPSALGPIDYNPTDEELKTIKTVDELFNRAKKARKAYDSRWLDYYGMFRGKQWKDARPTYRHSEVINLIFRAIQSEVPIITDTMPMPEFIPAEPGDFELAAILNDVLKSDWSYSKWALALTESIYDMHFYGTGFAYVGYNPDSTDGFGNIVFESSDPFYCYPDPSSTDVNTKSRYFIYAEPIDVDVLKKEYPDVAQFIKADLIDFSKKEKAQSDVIRYMSPTDNRTTVEGSRGYSLDQKNEALKICAYVNDLEYIEEQMDNPDGSKAYVQKMKYPNGRKIVIINGVLCEDGPIDYDDKKFPYIKVNNYILPREFWGISEIEQLESPQKIFNKLVSFSLDVLTLMGSPIWIVDNTSGIDTDNLTNRPGLIVEKEPGSEVRREAGVQLQPFVMQMIGDMKAWFDDISGSNDVSRGVRPEGITAASAITALQSASNQRIRQKTRNLDSFMQDFGQMYISRVFQYYSTPRVFRITDNENVTRYFKFYVDSGTDEFGNTSRVAVVRGYKQGVDGKYYLGEEKRLNAEKRFDVMISTGSGLPFEKARIDQQTFNLFDRGIIDSEEVLKNLKYPNRDSVITRMTQKAQGAPAPVTK